VRYALYAGASAVVGLSASPVFAQDAGGEKSDKLETIVVTGSRIRRVDIENASPVFVIDKAAIEKTGAVTIGDLIQKTPSIAGAATNPQVNNGGGSGASTVSLRGLGSARTLLLVNGRRFVYADVNSIPVNLVERIEILKDGASAVYGSDAVAGVVNFILRRDYQGMEANASYGISDHDDGERQSFDFVIGHSSDRGSLMVGGNYNKVDPVLARDRDFSKEALTLYSGEVLPGGSSRIPTGTYRIPRSVASSYGINCAGTASSVILTRIDGKAGTSPTDFRCASLVPGGDLYNFQADGNLLMTPQERGGLFAVGNYRISDHVEAYIEAVYEKTESNFAIAPLPFDARPAFDNVAISGQSYYNPFKVDIVNQDLRLRLSRIGNRTQYYGTGVQQFNAGLKGSFGDTWQWDAGMIWGHIAQDHTSFGYLYKPALQNALGPSFKDTDGIIKCGTAGHVIEGCVPVDFFGAFNGDQSQLDALNSISPILKDHYTASLKSFQANANGEIFELPAGSVNLAVGAEYRKESSDYRPDYLAITDASGNCLVQGEACTSPVSGSLSNKEIYAEVLVPILRDMAFAKALNVTLGTRYSDYSNFGNTTNSKLGVEWRPMDDLLVRGTYAEVFRAPTISDLYAGQTDSADTFSDPCNGYKGGGNPACTNVPTDGSFQQSNSQLPAVKGGNPNLQPEQGSVFTYGVVYDPSWLEGFSASLDLWRYVLRDAIGTIGTQTVLDQCFKYGRFCDKFSRDQFGEIFTLNDTNANIGRVDTKGVDIGFKYALPETAWGTFRFSLDTTYVAQFNSQSLQNEPTTKQHRAGTFSSSSAGGDGNYSRWRALGNVAWNLGAWDASWSMRYIGNFKVINADAGIGISDDLPQGVVLHYGSTTYHNLQAGYNIEPLNTRVEIGIDNVFNKQPPILYANNTLNANTDERTFDLMGRYFWARVGVKF